MREIKVFVNKLLHEKRRANDEARKIKQNLKKLVPSADCVLLGNFRELKNHADDLYYILDISFEQFIRLAKDECYYCGTMPVKDETINFNGISRLDLNKGYVIDNVVSCCKNYANAKGTMSHHGFIDFCYKVFDYSAKMKLSRMCDKLHVLKKT